MLQYFMKVSGVRDAGIVCFATNCGNATAYCRSYCITPECSVRACGEILDSDGHDLGLFGREQLVHFFHVLVREFL